MICQVHEVLDIIYESFKEIDQKPLRGGEPDYSMISSMIQFDVFLLFKSDEALTFSNVKFIVEAATRAVLLDSDDVIDEDVINQIAALMTSSLVEYKRIIREENMKSDYPEPKIVQAKQIEQKKWLN